jgi:hypothetical protein
MNTNIKKIILPFAILFLLIGCSNMEKTEKTLKIGEVPIEIPIEKTIDLPFSNYNHPVIHNDDIYLCTSNISNKESINSLTQYNINTGKQVELYKSRYSEAAMQWTKVNDNWLIWVDSSSDGVNANIMAMNLSTKDIKELAKTNPEYLTVLAPELYNDYVAWVELLPDNKVEVKLHNLKSNKTESIAQLYNYGLFNAFVSMKENRLLWTDTKDGQGYYFIYDINTKQTNKYTAPKQYPSYAVYSNDKIFSLNFDNIANWNNQSFGYFDIKSNKYIQLETGFTYVNSFDVYNDKIAIIDNKQKLHIYKINNMSLDNVKFGQKDNPMLCKFDQEGNLVLVYKDDTDNLKLGIIYNK